MGIATTATADSLIGHGYTGRFAPSPSGDLHLGSLYTAAASYLDARSHRGRWLVRMEDVDGPRVVPGASSRILRTLEAFGFEWSEPVVYQSERFERYAEALERLATLGLTFACTCSRAQLADDERYPGTCRDRARANVGEAATRLRVDTGTIQFTDRIQGMFRQDVAGTIGDLVLRRRDHLFAYVLAVVVDDDAQGVTDVLRGADLLDNTPRQIHLQRLLGYATPRYSHVPVLLEPNGSKLAKSARSAAVETGQAISRLISVFRLLNLNPPVDLSHASVDELWAWATNAWRIDVPPKRLAVRLGAKIA